MQNPRSNAADPGHICPPRSDARREASSRTRPAELPFAPTVRQRNDAFPTGRRHRHARPGRNQARDGPPPIRNRIALLRRDLETVRLHRQLRREKRKGIPIPVVALVVYTNAGKSTLFNALTDAGTVSSGQLFSTLDPLLRRLTLHNQLDIILSATVGFVRKLPHNIVLAFRATLEEVREADLLLHVV